MIRRAAGGSCLALLALAGCSLPLPQGVQSTRGVPAQQRPQDDITVIPPGPRPGQPPDAVVQGFLNAEASPVDSHAVARRFLAGRAGWDDRGDLLVYDPASLEVVLQREDAQSADVTTTVTVSATIRRDGSSAALAPRVVTDSYRLTRSGRDWRLASVPAGLRLTPADRDRSFSAVRTWFLAPPVEGEGRHVVPDAVFLPDRPDVRGSVDALVRRLVAGPSRSLAGSVLTAVPPGAVVQRVDVDATGVVQVRLTGGREVLTPARLEELSAQLVWTLRGIPSFTALRLSVGGQVVAPAGGPADQVAGSFDAYDPDGLGPVPLLFYVERRRLRALDTDLPPGPATTGDPGRRGAFAVDEVAVSNGQTRLALVSGTTLRIGPLRSTSYPLVLARPGLHAPSWGAGGLGLWLLQGSSRLLRVGGLDDVHEVPVDGAPGRLTALAVSRDGVRVALVSDGRLLVGRVDRSGGTVRVVGLVEVAPSLSAVTDVAWVGAASLAAVGTLQGTVLPVRLAVDGSSVVPLDGPGLPGPPVGIAASPAGIVVEARTPAGSRLFRATGNGFAVLAGRGTAPAYPG